MTEDIHELLHDLWTKAVGTPTYDKKQWGQLERALQDQGRDPRAERMEKAIVALISVMEIQEGRATGELHIPADRMRPIWYMAKYDAREALRIPGEEGEL